MDDSYLHFAGDPATDSARRHMERVLAAENAPRRRWPWFLAVLAGLAGGGTWTLWRLWRGRPSETDRVSSRRHA